MNLPLLPRVAAGVVRLLALLLVLGSASFAACDFRGEPQWRDPGFMVDTAGTKPLALFLTWRGDPPPR